MSRKTFLITRSSAHGDEMVSIEQLPSAIAAIGHMAVARESMLRYVSERQTSQWLPLLEQAMLEGDTASVVRIAYSIVLRHGSHIGQHAVLRLDAIMHEALGDIASSIDDLTRLIALDPSDGSAYAARARALLEIGNLDLALQDVSKAVSRNPGNAYYYKLRAGLHLAMLNDGEAVQDLDVALRLKPDDVESLAMKSYALNPEAEEMGSISGSSTSKLVNETDASTHDKARQYLTAQDARRMVGALMPFAGPSPIPTSKDKLSLVDIVYSQLDQLSWAMKHLRDSEVLVAGLLVTSDRENPDDKMGRPVFPLWLTQFRLIFVGCESLKRPTEFVQTHLLESIIAIEYAPLPGGCLELTLRRMYKVSSQYLVIKEATMETRYALPPGARIGEFVAIVNRQRERIPRHNTGP